MRFRRANVFCGVVLFACLGVMAANDGASERTARELPAIETVLMSPIEMESVMVWVPVVKAGPFINKGCDPQLNCSYSFAVRPKVEHRKDPNCLDVVARVLGEYTAGASGCDLPLTIFNGWQWECLYALGDRQTVTYDLAGYGGCWESSWEGQMRMSCSASCLNRVRISDTDGIAWHMNNKTQSNHVEVTTFSAVRTRDGYPKTRQF